MIRLSRESSYTDRFRNYKIFIDNIYYGNINNGEIKEVNIGIGQHTIYLTIDWCSSNKLTFIENNDELIEFQCGNSIKGFKELFLYTYFRNNKYLFVKFKEDAIS